MICCVCVAAEVKEPDDLRYIDPAMIGILAGMALMFVIICVVLRLFSKYVENYLELFYYSVLCFLSAMAAGKRFQCEGGYSFRSVGKRRV